MRSHSRRVVVAVAVVSTHGETHATRAERVSFISAFPLGAQSPDSAPTCRPRTLPDQRLALAASTPLRRLFQPAQMLITRRSAEVNAGVRGDCRARLAVTGRALDEVPRLRGRGSTGGRRPHRPRRPRARTPSPRAPRGFRSTSGRPRSAVEPPPTPTAFDPGPPRPPPSRHGSGRRSRREEQRLLKFLPDAAGGRTPSSAARRTASLAQLSGQPRLLSASRAEARSRMVVRSSLASAESTEAITWSVVRGYATPG